MKLDDAGAGCCPQKPIIPLHQQALAWGVSKKIRLAQRADGQFLLQWVVKH